MMMFATLAFLFCVIATAVAFRQPPTKFVYNDRKSKTLRMSAVDCGEGEFDNLVANAKGPVVVDFYADWCGPCKLMKPIFTSLADDYPDEIPFVKVDTDVHDEMQMRYRLQGLPLFAVFVNGAIVSSHSGALPKLALKNFIDKAFADNNILV
mmetsp:Transcript_18004/g.30273  ORF Transcript_18004/g.30273 Transcript_18004/m.30273 type:complete len:152 (+) Transcript_18004:138-593(+)|eukprot:CAMPEP_0174978444 /NCGR_PEP_ID=MMETSP0004_2-20121128/14208_1 /TAXON_ID=420556 /ORGANISM="Ochromonas sp., Strain CCMP1393" /LENGTH=151 /DNA_ID=CAMNT_0016229819 /DNA_START=71 /DNA_END=526 /DNA_ORIENTATION=+